ncbi:hypothetical protein MKK70_04845 [Methylobacterium sp. E-041]|uniref:hypothetical protein n=1 Tax=Methylobacterium sp. E-041 TaxID=2836573 RepID=UPI001FB97099|nr:hypothetical protein [Methylobacterium sp. E-041]MCJ2104714.1 hypothetical protein [Methylobacterium sp. E-041]
MLNRPEGPDPPLPIWLGHTPSWTSGDVLLWLKRAFGTNPATRSAAEIRPLNWLNDYLLLGDPQWERKRDILLLWAKCRADGASFQESIRGRPVKYGSSTTAYRLRDEAAAEIAAGINAAIAKAHAAVKRT